MIEPLKCSYDDEPAVDRVRWTVYGGMFKYALVCERHVLRVRGQRGMDLVGLPGQAMGEAIAKAEARRIDRGEL